MVGETTWFSQLDVQLFLLLVGGLVTPFLMESSSHLKKKWRPTSSTLVRKLSVMMDLTMRSRDSKKKRCYLTSFFMPAYTLEMRKTLKQPQFHHLSSHWPWSESKIRWKDELTQELLLAAYLEFCSSSNFLCASIPSTTIMVFENHRKSLIQHCERSEQCLHFEGTKVAKNAKNGLFWRVFENLKLAVKQC